MALSLAAPERIVARYLPRPPKATPVITEVHNRILILVHPGSLCGSADFNLGKYDGRAIRGGMIQDLDSWNGPVAVIDGWLSTELDAYPMLNKAIESCLDRAKEAGQLSLRIFGDAESETFNQVAAARQLIKDNALDPKSHRIELTGAWYHEDDNHGCVNSVWDVVTELGFSVDIRDSVMRAPTNDEDEDDDEDAEDVPRL